MDINTDVNKQMQEEIGDEDSYPKFHKNMASTPINMACTCIRCTKRIMGQKYGIMAPQTNKDGVILYGIRTVKF